MKKIVSIVLLLSVVVFVFFMLNASGVSRSVAMRESMQKTEEIYVYEGLPHQLFEGDKLAVESKRADVKKVGSYPFYNPPTLVEVKVVKSLKQWLTEETSFRKFSGEKKCGGFHPDYAVVWEGRKKDYAVLICFGCGEVIFTDGTTQLRYDLDVKAKDELKILLANFDKKRPNSKEPATKKDPE